MSSERRGTSVLATGAFGQTGRYARRVLFSLGPYELLIIAGVFGAITVGPMVAAAVITWVRRRRARKGS
jgi:hypothetical protein